MIQQWSALFQESGGQTCERSFPNRMFVCIIQGALCLLQAVQKIIGAVLKEEGHIDVVINNSGIAIEGDTSAEVSPLFFS